MNNLKDSQQDWEKKLNEFDKGLAYSRQISRSAIYRIIILSASIVGFSLSLVSISALQLRLNLRLLSYCWYFFLATIALGFLIVMFEGRVKYANTWKSFQLSQFSQTHNYYFRENFLAWIITIFTLLYPANLLFNKQYKDKNKKEFKERVNGLVVMKLAFVEHLLIFFENILFILFVCGLILLVSSFKF